jgi:FKBP-type peptidyl-prolyl cis-trans isomerase SlyD
MNISVNKMVTLSYVLRVNGNDGEIIEQTTNESPLQFVFGLGQMLPAFESNLSNLKQGDDFEMTLSANDSYGEFDEEAIVTLSKEIFIIDGYFDEERFKPGSQVPMQTSTGQRLNGRIIEVDNESIKMDFNHPLAGNALHFTGKIIEVRDATEEELMPSGCACGCDSGCSSDSGCCDSNGCSC